MVPGWLRVNELVGLSGMEPRGGSLLGAGGGGSGTFLSAAVHDGLITGILSV